jgi:FtsZ-binding cell division protein ZapB
VQGAPPPVGGPQVVIPGAGWVDVASRAITTVGFPVVVAGALLWFVLGRFQTNMELITARMEANTKVAAQFIASQQQEITELQTQTREMQQQTQAMRAISDKLERFMGATGRGKGDG